MPLLLSLLTALKCDLRTWASACTRRWPFLLAASHRSSPVLQLAIDQHFSTRFASSGNRFVLTVLCIDLPSRRFTVNVMLLEVITQMLGNCEAQQRELHPEPKG